MKDKTKYLVLSYVNWLFLALGLLFFILFLLKRQTFFLVLFPTFLIVYTVITRICDKALQCEGGYSLIQAVSFYTDCASAGYHGTKSKQDLRILQDVAEKRDVFQALDDDELRRCYQLGCDTFRTVKDPFLKAWWTRSRKK